jgi:hypothetical protein
MRCRSKEARSSFRLVLIVAAAVWLIGDKSPPALAGGDLSPQKGNEVLPLTQFLASVRAAHYNQYAGRAGATVAGKDAFAEMQAYIMQRYEHIDVYSVKHYVVDAADSIFDCLPQAASTNLPPTPPKPPRDVMASDSLAQQNLITSCPAGTIPVQRITLETLVKFPHLRNFFQK